MQVCWLEDDLTQRTTTLTLIADTFDDERILKAVVDVAIEKGILTAKTRRRVVKYRFTQNAETSAQ